MRVRKKSWARPELESSVFVITDPTEHKGKWKDVFKNSNPIFLELGCGTGKFICENALNSPEKNYIGIDVKDEILVYAKRNVESIESLDSFSNNIRLVPMNVELIDSVFDREEISRIYINFCNPWPKSKQNKRRLTHNLFLEKYKHFLKPSSQIWFKTDDALLFHDSIEYFKAGGFKLEYITENLHKSGFENNIMTEYEKKFAVQGMPIMFLIAALEQD
jgi:tRNA (guanine-N7-)-methyltransferase